MVFGIVGILVFIYMGDEWSLEGLGYYFEDISW